MTCNWFACWALGGSLPLAVLQKEVEGWIAEKKGGKVAEQLH
jgi:hypothetical protein